MKETENILSYFPQALKSVFNLIDSDILVRINEIRIRRNKPIVVVIKNGSYFLDYNGDLYDFPGAHTVFCSSEEFEELFMELCSYSVYSSMENMKNGFITLEGGARIGLASTAVYEKGELIAVKDVNSLNIRIPREVRGCANKVLNFLYVNSFPSVIVAGRANSGKTTLLRDMARSLSGGFNHRFRKVSVIDERNEIAGNGMDLGANADILTGFSKAKGIELATRTLSPEMIICDEISTESEVKSILYGFSSGISFALSVHIGKKQDLLCKPIIKTLLSANEFSYIVLLNDYSYKPEIIEASEVYREICRNCGVDDFINDAGLSFIG